MKKYLLIGSLLLLVLGGCSKGIGKFQDDSIDVDMLYQKINEKTEEGEWAFPLLNDTFLEHKDIEKVMQLDMNLIRSSFMKQSALPTELGEIGFFKVQKGQEALMKTKIEKRMQALRNEYVSLLPYATSVLDSVQQGMIGQYYYMVIGADAKKVVNYVHSLE